MKLEEFYNSIKQNNVTSDLIIFKNPKNDFIANQYIEEIANQHQLQKVIVEDLLDIPTYSTIFNDLVDPVLYIYRTDKLDSINQDLMGTKNVVISCNSINKEIEKIFSNFIITIPVLEDWQIKDYVYTQLEGMEPKYLDWLISICNNDIYRISLEVDRLKIFTVQERNLLINKFNADYIYEDLNNTTVFNLINAIIKKDKNTIIKIYNDIKTSNISIYSIINILYTNIKNIIVVQLTPGITADNCGFNKNQFWALKHNINIYNKQALLNIFYLITDIDRKIKTGELEVAYVLDYLLVNILSL